MKRQNGELFIFALPANIAKEISEVSFETSPNQKKTIGLKCISNLCPKNALFLALYHAFGMHFERMDPTKMYFKCIF